MYLPKDSGATYGSVTAHKLKGGEGLNEIALRAIVSYLETTTCNEAKYLANLLALFGKSDYTIINTQDIINRLRKESI